MYQGWAHHVRVSSSHSMRIDVMYICQMCLETNVMFGPVVTERTGKGGLACMFAEMCLEVATCGGAVGTVLTLIWFLTKMGSDMNSKGTGITGLIVTDVTFKSPIW